MASPAGHAPSTGFRALQIGAPAAVAAARERLEHWLEAERDQLPLWIPVLLGGGIAAWFVLPDAARWTGFLLGSGALALVGAAAWRRGRAGRALAVAGALLALGCALIWWRAERVRAPVLAGPTVAAMTGKVTDVEPLAARGVVRLTIAPEGTDLPPQVRVNLATQDVPATLTRGARVALRARLVPPPEAAVPGAYDFARVAWFAGIGATGRGFAPVTILAPGEPAGSDLRMRLSEHIRTQIGGGAGAIAATLATGDEGAIPEEDVEAMRRSGLAHLLSISGLHVTAVTGAAMLLVLRLLALVPGLALRWRLPLVAAGGGAAAAIGYTLLTGAEVPTVRSCAAALLVLAAMALGREAITLRLIAAGATFVLLLWPESLAGPSFQLSFAAVTAIVALHESARVRGWFAPREESRIARMARGLASLLLTGLVVEAVLLPIAVFHFHRAGMFGALANMVAIPLTTFVVMPLEAGALLLDGVGLGAPLWWLAGQALAVLLAVAHGVAAMPGAVTPVAAMPGAAFALIVAGGLWVALWRTRARLWGALPVAVGLVWTLATPAPDVLVTGDGRHLALRTDSGALAVLRDRAGDYVRGLLRENGGEGDGDLPPLEGEPGVSCSADLCIADVTRGGRRWRIAATRSAYPVPWAALIRVCGASDVMVSERRLPAACRPRWLKLDSAALAASGGVALWLGRGEASAVRTGARHPWVDPPTTAPEKARPGEARRERR